MIEFFLSIEAVVILFILLLVHELGHGLIAFLFGHFESFSFHWWGATTNIKLPMGVSEYLYVLFAGFLFSFLVTLWFMLYGIISASNLWFLTILFGSIFDFLWIFAIVDEIRINPFFDEIKPDTYLNFTFGLVQGKGFK